MEEHQEQIKVQQQLLSKKEGGGRMGGGMGGRGPHTPGGGRTSQPQDEGWNTVPISKNRPIDTTRLSKITKVRFWVQSKKSASLIKTILTSDPVKYVWNVSVNVPLCIFLSAWCSGLQQSAVGSWRKRHVG